MLRDEGTSPIRRHRLVERRGQSLVEFGLVLPILLVLVVGILEFGIAFRTYQVVTNSAREGARTAVLRTDLDEVIDRVEDYLESGGLGSGQATITVSCGGAALDPEVGGRCSRGQIATVEVSHPVSFAMLGAILGQVFGVDQVRSVSRMRTE